MRTIVTAFAILAAGGCAETKGVQRKPGEGRSARATPVVTESTRLSERLRVSRQQTAEEATRGDTQIQGNVVR